MHGAADSHSSGHGLQVKGGEVCQVQLIVTARAIAIR